VPLSSLNHIIAETDAYTRRLRRDCVENGMDLTDGFVVALQELLCSSLKKTRVVLIPERSASSEDHGTAMRR
jgi:hypothetical protein